MTDEQLKDLLEIIINNTYEKPSYETDFLLYSLPTLPDNPNSITSVTIYPLKGRKFKIIPYNYLEIAIWGYSENKSVYKKFTLEDKYYFEAIKQTIISRKRIYDKTIDDSFKKALDNSFDRLGE